VNEFSRALENYIHDSHFRQKIEIFSCLKIFYFYSDLICRNHI